MISDNKYKEYFSALLQGNRSHCLTIVNELATQGIPVSEIYEDILRRSLYQVGDYWELNKISVATEHMATAITEGMMIQLQPRIFTQERVGKKAVIACVANEHHQVGAKMIADTFEMHGWDTQFIGSNTPSQELLRFIKTTNPDLIGLSLSIYFNLPTLRETLTMIRNTFPDIPIIIGGQAFRWGGIQLVSLFPKVAYIQSMSALQDYIRNIGVMTRSSLNNLNPLV